MAIDTAAKRLSILDFGNVFQPGMPIPNSTLDVDDRMQLLWAFAPEFVAYVITPGCATLTISQLHMTAILDSLVGSATLSDALAHISLASELTCNPALTVAVGTLEAWNDTGVLEPLYETATGQVADATFGCYALAAIGSRIYIGLANWPGSTNGGLIISTTNGKTFTIEKILDEQGVHELSVHGGVLWVPGTDPTDDWTMGNVYRYLGGVWTKLRTLPNTIHTLGLWHDGTHLHVGVGAHAGDNVTWFGQVFRSTDNGATWDAAVTISNYRVYDIIGWQARLYATTYLQDTSRQLQYSADDGATWSIVGGTIPAQNPRLVIWGIYLIGATLAGGLFAVDATYVISSPAIDFTVYTAGFSPLAIDGAGYLYALASDGTVYRTNDLITWVTIATVTGALGIHYADGYIYIPVNGQILRVVI